MMSARLDHIAIAIHSIKDAFALFNGCLGGEFLSGGDIDARHLRTMQLKFGTGKVELMQPTDELSPLNEFFERRGQGFHHMTLICDDVEEEMSRLIARGYAVVNPDLSSPTWREVYLRPSAGFGALVQLADSTLSWDASALAARRGGITPDDVISGRVMWLNQIPTLRTEA